MNVYIELVIFNNFFLDAMLALAVLTARRRRVQVRRVLLTAGVGSAAAAAYAVAPIWARVLIRILLAPMLCAILAKPQGKSAKLKLGDYICTLAVFVLLTFFLGGMIYGASYVTGIDLKSHALLGLTAFAVCVLTVSVRLIARKRNAPKEVTRRVTVSAAGREICVDALCDSGNLLVDDVSGLPVVILSAEAEQKLCALDIKGFIQVSTVGGEDSLALVGIDEVGVNGKKFKALGALSRKSFGDFDVILQNSMF